MCAQFCSYWIIDFKKKIQISILIAQESSQYLGIKEKRM